MRNYKYRRPVSRAFFDKPQRDQPLGGARPVVQKRFLRAQNSAERTDFPAMAALIYQPPSIVHTPVEILDWSQPGGMVDRLYQPAQEKPRTFGDKLQAWFKSGRFA